MNQPVYLAHLAATGQSLNTSDGRDIPVMELTVPTDPACLSDWAKRFRQNYCLDAEIEELLFGTGLSRAEYLIRYAFPDESVKPGPSIRSGDFAELLLTDYVEFVLGYRVLRDKYGAKESRDESAKGVDIIGLRQLSPGVSDPCDELLTYEVKGQLSGGKYTERLQKAIDDSAKDYFRTGTSLNAAKKRFIKEHKTADALEISRFQNPNDNPYRIRCGAAAVLSDDSYCETSIGATKSVHHVDPKNLELLVIKGTSLMALAHSIYKLAADEA
ncbi:DUF1837 domain-containing protein [Oxalobacteraceae sp. CFBP 8755]|nr:DUF1837 domain-containing protein [Oxalobacteraceae sp. CFBP 8755]